jgi:2-keto-3-deoxy-L-rhamnonate aldolase RhmA/quercetin dioxygenase-like cupin family protein
VDRVVAKAAAIRDRLPEGIDGLFVKLATTETLEAASTVFDFCVVDLEHSTLGESEAMRLLQHARALAFPALVRIPHVDPFLINRALEAGAVGIQISSIRRCEEVAAARAAMQFPPEGRRSVSTAHGSAGFGAVSLRNYVDRAERPLLVVQIEDVDSDDPLDEILANGVDVAFVGTSDLTVAAGFDASPVADRVDEIAAAASSAGVAFGAFALEHEQSHYRIACSDISLFTEALGRRKKRPPAHAHAAKWDSLPAEVVRPGVSRRAFGTDACMLVMNTCEPGMELRPHSHSFDQIALITEGHGCYHVGEIAHPVGPGSVLLVPAGVTHYMETTDEVVENLDVFAPPRADYAHLVEWMEKPGE